ncbi:MAG: SurA N-terminal domain-containing protein [Gloeobacteraceae cyanobacterium ES-bin-144]|nr:SurA N-terminal domain-containing protein [Verrucomicrobiales bacterium]
MIEKIQRYKTAITISLAAIGAGLMLGGSDFMKRNSGGGTSLIKISGIAYDSQEYSRIGKSSFQLVSNLARSGDMGLYQFVMTLSSGATNEDDAEEKFFIGRIILHQAKEDFGIYPDQAAIAAYVHQLRSFSDQDGKYNEETYRNFIAKGIGRFGMTEGDFLELVSDVLVFQELNKVVGSGLTVNRDIVALNLALENQQINGELAQLSIDPFTAKIEPSEADIKSYWETIQDAFTTEPLRKFSYIIVTPDMPAEEAKNENSIIDAAATDEAKKLKELEKTKRAAALSEARRAKQIETDKLVDDFTFDLETDKGVGFEDLASKNKWEVKTTALFSRTKAPKELDIALRASSRGGKIVDELFRIEPTSDPLSKFSQPVAIGENQWIIARLEAEEKSRIKTFEEAREEARAQYISEKAKEALKAAANEAATKIKASLDAGKTFADAAKEAGINESKSFTKVTSTYRPDPATEPRTLFENTRYVDPGSIAEVLLEPDRAFIIHVSSREVVKEPNAAARLDNEIVSRTSENETLAFVGWLTTQIEAAKVERLNRR